jgi:predicted secreted Zn-dependent protease
MNGEREGKEVLEKGLPFPRAAILEHLARARRALRQICDGERADSFGQTLSRVASRLRELEKDFARAARPNAQKLEDSLTSLEKMLDEALRAHISSEKLAAVRRETEDQLQPYRGRMERDTYEQTFDNLLMKRLREQRGIPRLSLFYL